MSRTRRRFDGTNIKSVMDVQGRRNDWLADVVGVPQYTVTRWLNGTSLIGEEHAKKVSQVLGIPFLLLFDSNESNTEHASVEPREAVPA